VERAVIAARVGSLRFDLPDTAVALTPSSARKAVEIVLEESIAVVPQDQMRRRERENIAAALEVCKGRIYGADGAAKLLGMKPTTLSARVKKLGLK
jgi:transcriptional regulator with GAF, ATPase, and Fis domain